MNNSYHLVFVKSKSAWCLKRENNEKHLELYKTKSEAVKKAKEKCKREETDLYIYKKNGTQQYKNVYRKYNIKQIDLECFV